MFEKFLLTKSQKTHILYFMKKINHENYQVCTDFSTGRKVSQLTEKEAKDELCRSMDLIAKMMHLAEKIVDEAQKENY